MVDLVNELEGQVAIVTGSARNIGRATAMELARAGASLVINSRESKELCEEVAHSIESNGGRAIPVVADITDRDAVDAMVAEAVKAFGGVDILVNNAAVLPLDKVAIRFGVLRARPPSTAYPTAVPTIAPSLMGELKRRW